MSNGNTFEHDNWKFTEELKSETHFIQAELSIECLSLTRLILFRTQIELDFIAICSINLFIYYIK
jgi:hypothetical protein